MRAHSPHHNKPHPHRIPRNPSRWHSPRKGLTFAQHAEELRRNIAQIASGTSVAHFRVACELAPCGLRRTTEELTFRKLAVIVIEFKWVCTSSIGIISRANNT
jgi:hypothetical protein